MHKLFFLKTKKLNQNKVQLITLGCSKNWVDSENLMTQLSHNQIDVEHNPNSKTSNTVIINTCGFIDRAKEESINTILEYANLKSQGIVEKLYVTGCLSQRYKSNLEEEIPEVDAFFGTMEMPALLATLNADYKQELVGERIISTPSHYAYLKISEGCNRTCSFCAIPLMRGKHVSVPLEQLIKQASYLASMGVKELILIAQELTYYGLDIYKKRSLHTLLGALSNVNGIEWIRLHYAYPSKFPLEILDVIKSESKICNYLDIPLQHFSDPVLKNMKRQISQEETRALVQNIRDKIPEIHLRTTMLVGFPGETENDFNTLCKFIEETKFERLGVFQYSHEEDTSAYKLDDNIPPEIKEERALALMQIQEQISFESNQQKIGKTFKTLIDKKENACYIGRTEFDSPEVDNEVIIKSDATNYIRVGDFINATIFQADAFDLHANVSTL
ncbi:MAG: 30S ribosomal protein S12 methylthiotransferase RimO [Saprospiraceae bacterium]